MGGGRGWEGGGRFLFKPTEPSYLKKKDDRSVGVGGGLGPSRLRVVGGLGVQDSWAEIRRCVSVDRGLSMSLNVGRGIVAPRACQC